MAPKRGRDGRRSKSPQPWWPPAETRSWQEVQAERLDAARQVYGGLGDVGEDEVLTHLYQDSVQECVEFAVKHQQGLGKGAGKKGKKAKAAKHHEASPQPGQAASSSQPAPSNLWPHYRSNEEANLLQNRLGEDLASRFHPARHTVMIVGRPVQATTSAMPLSHEPPAMRQESIQVPLFLKSSLGAR